MVASSGTVAGTFFASTSWLGAIGLAPVAATPIGWVLGAAVLTGGAYYGVMRAFGAYRKALVDDVPRFINAPIDALGAAIVDMLGAMALRVAVADGAICDTERTHIRDYFIDEWGIDEIYAHEALAVIEENLNKASLEQLVATFARFAHRQHDCKLDVLRQRLEELLTELVEADGSVTPEEFDAISCIIDGLKSSGRGGSLPHLAKTWIGRVFMGVPEAAKQQPAC
jgi:uncharacterized tellurite resistance protein B-like protein